MITQARLDRLSLSPRPLGQRLVASLLLAPNYELWPHRTRIRLEGEEHLPRGGRGAVLVMNHTDRYNYWPLQYQLWRRGLGFTATWVKGKYYENAALGWFMDWTNNIPIPSRGYLATKDFQQHLGRLPSDAEYQVLKRLEGGAIDEQEARAAGGEAVARLLGQPWPDGDGRWRDSLARRFAAMMARVVAINREALDRGLHLLIFPEGTRSRRLGSGHTGAAQIILSTGAAVVPIGCNGSDRCYPGSSPWSRGGDILYRIGAPLLPEGELAPFRIAEPFAPYSAEADRHQPTFRALTDLLMDRIEALLDPAYRRAGGAEAATTGARRFV